MQNLREKLFQIPFLNQQISKRIKLISGECYLCLPEGDYLHRYRKVVIIHWQHEDWPYEDMKRGLRLIPVVEFTTPNSDLFVPICSMADGIRGRYMSGTLNVKSALLKYRDYVLTKRGKAYAKMSESQYCSLQNNNFLFNFQPTRIRKLREV